jgi:lysophospholipase L1-like esterase
MSVIGLRRPLRGVPKSAACILVCALLRCMPVLAQLVGIVDDPCPDPFTPSAAFQALVVGLLVEPHTITPEELQRFNESPELTKIAEATRRLAGRDWAGLCRFRAADAKVQAAPVHPRVVFMGDSITENWGLADPMFFDGAIVNRGISGQTTAQMLVRFRADVVALRPQTVHILAGTNDVAGNTGPMTAQDFKNNIMSMVELARANGVDVVIASIPPAAAFGWRPEVQPVATIKALNRWLQDYSARQGLSFVDYYAPLVGPDGEFRADLSNDGVHPNRRGYAIMRRLAEASLAPRSR